MNDDEASATKSDELKQQGPSDSQMLKITKNGDLDEHDKRKKENAILESVFTNLMPKNDPFKLDLKTDSQSRSSSENDASLESALGLVLSATAAQANDKKPDDTKNSGGTNRPEGAGEERKSSEDKETGEERRTDEENKSEERISEEPSKMDVNS